ncbi:MAG TPA: FAD-dependent oxidoreductase, partial [Clostridiaceae bacterium]|nr:FAD-dependent oxidoreductase [Clostridiaceae bacterium]
MEIIHSDLTVAGAGIAGMCAALAAARHGLKVALINDRPVLGGNASSEVAVSISGSAAGGGSNSVYAREGGIVEEIKLTRLHYNQMEMGSYSVQDWPMEDAAYFDLIYNEKNISLYLNTSVRSAQVENGKVKALMAVQVGSEKQLRFESPLFIDSTGDGTVGYNAGALYMWGEEAKNEFNESLAPQKHTGYVMGSTILFFTRDAGKKVTYRRPDFAYDITKLDYFNRFGNSKLARGIHREGNVYNGYWWVEIGGLLDTIHDNEKITLELRKIAYGLWDYIKNSGKFEGVDNLLLDKVTQIAGKRESRRFTGDYVLTQNDIEDKTDFPDKISIGGWTMDVHAPNGIYDEGPATHWHPINGIYNLPFRCMYSKNILNLMLAGRDISCTHIAMGSTRVMGTCACTGQAVGTAAYLCNKYGIYPSSIIKDGHIEELQDELQRDDQTIMGRREKYNPELLSDLTVSASSTRAYTNPDCEAALQLTENYCMAFPVEDRIDSLEVKVANSSDEKRQMNINIYGGKRPENYIPDTHLKDISVDIPGNFEGWINLPVSVKACSDKKVYIIFNKDDSLKLFYNNEKIVGIVTFRCRKNTEIDKYPKSGIFRLSRQEKNISFRNIKPAFDIYGAENVI